MKLEKAIEQMVKVVKPGGWIIAVEPVFGFDMNSNLRIISEPKDISYLFDSFGLQKQNLVDSPEWSYCYRKLSDD